MAKKKADAKKVEKKPAKAVKHAKPAVPDSKPKKPAKTTRPAKAVEAKQQDRNEVRFEVYKDSRKEWRWRLVAGNNKIIGDSGEGYSGRDEALRAVGTVRECAATATIRMQEIQG